MEKIKSVNQIKLFSFLTIFLLHCESILKINTNNSARLGVEIFIVLSGFLIMYNYRNKFDDNSLTRKKFILKKIINIYPLFLLSLLLKLPSSLMKYYIEFGGLNPMFFFNSLKRFIPSLLLFQAFIPDSNYYFAYNGVSWFIDILVFCYLFTPFLVKKIKKLNLKKSVSFSVILFLFQSLYILIANYLNIDDYWIYIFPIFRLFDYIQGMILCNIYVCYKTMQSSVKIKQEEIKYTICEFLIILLISISIIYKFVKYDIFNIILSILLLFVFLQNKGIISKTLSNNRIINAIGDLNFELYFLHQPLIRYFEFILKYLNVSKNLNIIMFLLLCFIIFFVAHVYNKCFSKKINHYLQQKFLKNY